MRTLVVPPAAQRDGEAVQMLSAWIAERGLHCTMNVGMWTANGTDEPSAWGTLLADVVRHLGDALQKDQGIPREEVIRRITEALSAELEEPTSASSGEFHPGQN